MDDSANVRKRLTAVVSEFMKAEDNSYAQGVLPGDRACSQPGSRRRDVRFTDVSMEYGRDKTTSPGSRGDEAESRKKGDKSE